MPARADSLLPICYSFFSVSLFGSVDLVLEMFFPFVHLSCFFLTFLLALYLPL
jgi:hypothetical protein